MPQVEPLNNRSKIIQNVLSNSNCYDEENEIDLFSSLGIGIQKGTNHKQAFIAASISRSLEVKEIFPRDFRFEFFLSKKIG